MQDGQAGNENIKSGSIETAVCGFSNENIGNLTSKNQYWTLASIQESSLKNNTK